MASRPKKRRSRRSRSSLGNTWLSFARSGLRLAGQLQLPAAPSLTSVQPTRLRRLDPAGPGQWLAGWVTGPAGGRHYRLYKPSGVVWSDRLPLLVMLHGCGQTATGFALSTRMNRLAEREKLLVLYPEQSRQANPQGCWNWFSTASGLAQREADTVLAAVDQVCRLYPAHPRQVAVAGLSAGASMAALLAIRHPERFRAVVMHSGVPPGLADSSASAWHAMQGRVAGPPAPPSPTSPWPPVLVIHGSQDKVVSSHNAQAAASLWAQTHEARAGASRTVTRGQRLSMVVTDHKRQGQVVARCCEIAGLGHAWSGADEREPHGDARGPDATRLLWAFVKLALKRD